MPLLSVRVSAYIFIFSLFNFIILGNGDNHSSGGSTGTRSSSLGAAAGFNFAPKSSAESSPKSVYVLENAFCDNLKTHSKISSSSSAGGDKHFKDALLTVTGKFGKNIIKYKFNIFAEEQQKLVQDLIPTNERSMPFKDIKAMYEQQSGDEEEIVVRRNKNSSSSATTPQKASASQYNAKSNYITAEEKTIYNLYLICKSAKISHTNFVDRYRALFDEYTATELIAVLNKLAQIMQDNGDSPLQAQQSCYEMYFNYLNADLIWEMDDITRDYISQGFILLNSATDIVRCDNCSFPLRFDNSCQYHEIGTVLLRYFWSRNEQEKCFDVLNHVPAMFDVLARFYMAENNLEKVLPIIMNYGQTTLLQEMGRMFSFAAWARCFEQFVELQQGRLACVNCECVTTVENVNRHFFYTWNCFLNIALEHLEAQQILALIFKWSNFIPNDAIDRDFYSRCLLKG